MKSLQNKSRLFVILLLTVLLICPELKAQNSETRILDINRDSSTPTTGLWCWAGCISSIANYYGNNTTRCQVAELRRLRFPTWHPGGSNCCSITSPYSQADSTSCVSGAYFSSLNSDEIGKILYYDFGIHNSYIESVLSYSQIKDQINNNKPIKIVSARDRGDGSFSYHSMIIIGYDDNNNTIYYIDPGYGYMQDSYNDIITTECMGYSNQYQYGLDEPTTWTMIPAPCPINLLLEDRIGSDATIKVQNDIVCKMLINNNAIVTITAGNSVTLSGGLETVNGCELTINTSVNPCN